jgi:hypothetical protein
MSSIARYFTVLALTICNFTAVFGTAAYAQTAKQQAPAARQMALNEKHIESLLAAQKDIDAFTAKTSPSSSVAQTNANIVAQLDAVVKKHGFASYSDYNIVLDNIGLVMAGMDSKTKTYVGPAAVTRQKIATIQADKTMSAEDKKDALSELDAAAKAPLPPVEHKGNIDLVAKYFDKLAAIMRDE